MPATLSINLGAIARNYQLLAGRFTGAECAAVVKADAYGLGAAPITSALYKAGCRTFFVATLKEALEIRPLVKEATVLVFHGAHAGEELDFIANGIRPVLNSRPQIERWRKANIDGAPAALHVDTGMSRLGVSLTDLSALENIPGLVMLMSHLALAEEPSHFKNREQLENFKKAVALLPATLTKSLVNSSGIFLGSDFHFDLARPGCALYGINPLTGAENPMENVVQLTAPILQIREAKKGQTVGYDATFTAPRDIKVAVVEMGYADGYLRALSGKGKVFIGEYEVPIIGRVSMDLVTLDITDMPEPAIDARAEFIGSHMPVGAVADLAGTIGYEVFTRLGNRIQRLYHGQLA